MVSRAELKEYLTENLDNLIKILKEPDKVLTNEGKDTEKICEALVKASIAVDPESFFSIISSVLESGPALPRLIEELLLRMFQESRCRVSFESIKSKEEKFKYCPVGPNGPNLQSEQVISEVLELRTENEGLRMLLDDCNHFLLSIKEDSREIDSVSYKLLKSLKQNLASRSTLPSLAKRDTDSAILSIDQSHSLDLSYMDNSHTSKHLLAQYNKSQAKIAQISDNSHDFETSFTCRTSSVVSISNKTLKLFKNFQQAANKKLQSLNEKLTNLHIQISDTKFNIHLLASQKLETKNDRAELELCRKYLKKVLEDKEQLQDFYEDLKQEKKELEIRFVKNTLNLETQLQLKSSKLQEKADQIMKLESKLESIHKSDKSGSEGRLEQLIITNVTLQGEISILESQNARMRSQIEQDESRYKSFSQELDLTNNSKSSELFDSKPLNKDREISELREALRTISERFEKDKENLLKDLEESRQDMEVQIFRLKQEKAYQESICKDLQKHLNEVHAEKQVMEKELLWLRQICERHGKSPRHSKPDEFVSSLEFDISKSIEVPDKSNTLPHKTIQDAILEELNEISVDLKKKRKTDLNTCMIFELVKNTLAHMIKIYEAIESETSGTQVYKETARNLSDVVSKLKLKVRNIEEESVILNKRIDQSLYDKVYTEPGARISDREQNELLQYYKKQLQIEKAKVLEKKHVIKLHKEQINYLKQTLRDLQFELGKINTVDFEYIKAVFISLIKEIPQQSEKTESIIGLLSSLLNLSESDRASLRETRTSPFSLINN